MSKLKDDYVYPRTTGLGQQAPGMELRDWFAGLALQGIMSRMSQSEFDSSVNADDWSMQVGDAYEIADAMIEERNREQN